MCYYYNEVIRNHEKVDTTDLLDNILLSLHFQSNILADADDPGIKVIDPTFDRIDNANSNENAESVQICGNQI